MDHAADVRDRYARFAADAGARSPLYADWAAGVGADDAVAGVVGRIPPTQRQPPLVFAASRMLGAPESGYDDWRTWVLAHADSLVAECGTRSLQTNEPQRCTVLLAALGLVPGPIALIEVGASAGLCMYPDRYTYTYASDRSAVVVGGPGRPHLRCRVRGARMPMLRRPEIVWRAGIDLHPLSAGDSRDRSWLTHLVWPGETGRAERIVQALDVVAAEAPRIHAGDATELLPRVAAQAPADATLVVTTPGVLPHVIRAERARLVATARSLGRWITLDPPALGTLDEGSAPGEGLAREEGFLVGVDGRTVGIADPLGAWLEWRTDDRPSAR